MIKEQPISLFERLLSQPISGWLKLCLSLLILALPLGAAALDGYLNETLRQGQWRFLILPSAVIVYVWLISPRVVSVGVEVLASLRPLVALDDEEFEQRVLASSQLKPAHEWLAFGLGASLGVVSASATNLGPGSPWQVAYWYLSNGFMYGLLGWGIYASLVSTRLNAAMQQAPLRFDILDPTPFEPVGRQSLLLALVFVGGITFSQLLAFQPQNFSLPIFWIANLLLALPILLIFFLSMRPIHRLLAEEKSRLLRPVQAQLRRAGRELIERLEQGQDAADLPTRINALALYEARLQAARTWPYNTATLRTLFFSVFIPLFTVLGRLLVEVWVR